MKHALALILSISANFSIQTAENTSATTKQKLKIGLCIMATGRYINFMPQLIRGVNEYFCKNHDVKIFVFTDQPLEEYPNVTRVQQAKLGWPYDSMYRFKIYNQNKHLLDECDYIFACDSDLSFVNPIGEEVLSDRVAVHHPGFINNKRGTYEEKEVLSLAYVKPNEGEHYFTGAFYGGNKKEFFALIKQLDTNVDEDLKKNITALWHDESHLNRYFIDNPPTKQLSTSYYYPEVWPDANKKKILALEKNHAYFRA